MATFEIEKFKPAKKPKQKQKQCKLNNSVDIAAFIPKIVMLSK